MDLKNLWLKFNIPVQEQIILQNLYFYFYILEDAKTCTLQIAWHAVFWHDI